MNTIRTSNSLRPALLAAVLSVPSGAGAAPAPPAAIGAAPTVMAAPATAAPAATSPPKPLVSSEVGSYDIGLLLGSQLQHNGVVPNLSQESLLRGLKEAMGGRPVSADEREAALNFMRQARSTLADKNRAEGKEFLARNAKAPGVVTLPSGLQYKVLAEGDPKGKTPAPMDEVTVRYRTSLPDGTEIDRSDTHGVPATFRVNSVFKAWQEAFAGMKPGAKWQLFVPPELGYGNNTPPSVPPGAVLIYDLELLKIEARDTTPLRGPTAPTPSSGAGKSPAAAAPTH
jgi:FKBP-type peptidyl-prolyl cis-trans isomerase FklB